MAKLVVKNAIYGALPGGNSNDARAFNVTAQLQELLNSGTGVVACNNANFGDPAPGFTKHFGALVERDGTALYFACNEGQTIDFTHGGGVAPLQTMTVKFAVYGALPGGAPSEAQAFDVTSVVQAMVNQSGGPVACNNASFGDPSPGNGKHFAAVVNRSGADHNFACAEGQVINFSTGGNP